MDFHELSIAFLATIIGFLIAQLTDGLFIGRTKNKRAYLRGLGLILFGTTNQRSEFISTGKGVIIKIIDVISGFAFGTITYKISVTLIEKTFIFYFPLTILSLNSAYLLIRKQFDKIRFMEWFIIIVLYIIGIVWTYFVIKNNL